MKEKDLFPILKKHFKDKGYTVYAEVPYFSRGIDFVAVKGEEHIAVEMKLSFNKKVIQQANYNTGGFCKSYVAFPRVNPLMIDRDYWEYRESLREKIDWCQKFGVGILQVIPPHNIIFEALESVDQKPYKLFDFSQYTESEKDEAGLPCQKGVSAGYYELKGIKEYVRKNPQAKWREIFENVQNHYENEKSMAGSMSQWRGFRLSEFKKSLN